MTGRPRSSLLVAAGIGLTVTAGVLAATTDARGTVRSSRSRVSTPPISRSCRSTSRPPRSRSPGGATASEYRVSLGNDLSRPDRTIVTTEPRAVLVAPRGRRPERQGQLPRRAVDDGTPALPSRAPSPAARGAAEAQGRGHRTRGRGLKWKPADYATTYDVALSRSKQELPRQVKRLESGGTSFATDELKPETTYYGARARGRPRRRERVRPATKVVTPPDTSDLRIGSWNICSEACKGYGGRAAARPPRCTPPRSTSWRCRRPAASGSDRATRAAFSGGPGGWSWPRAAATRATCFYSPDKLEQLAGGRWPLGHGRWATWARLQDLETERPFIVVSVHLLSGHNKTASGRDRDAHADGLRGAVNPEGRPSCWRATSTPAPTAEATPSGPIVRAHGFRDTVEVAD